MSDTQSKSHEADRDPIYFEADLHKAYSEYAFNFTIDGAPCRTWYDPEKEVVHFDAGDAGESLFQLMIEIERSIEKCFEKSDVDHLDLRKFALKHLQAMIRVGKKLQRVPAYVTEEMDEAEMEEETKKQN
jgi:hypothetical protein